MDQSIFSQETGDEKKDTEPGMQDESGNEIIDAESFTVDQYPDFGENEPSEDVIEEMQNQQVEEEISSPLSEEAISLEEDLPEPEIDDLLEKEEVAEETKEEADTVSESGVIDKKDKRSFFEKAISPDTRLGRIVRPVLRWSAAVVGFFALGLLAGYLMLYSPTKKDLEEQVVQLEAKNLDMLEDLGSVQQDLSTLQTEYSDLETKYLAIAKQGSRDQIRISFLEVVNNIAESRLALMDNDLISAKLELGEASAKLAELMPTIREQDENLADLLESRLEVTVAEIGMKDGASAEADLQKLSNTLLQLENVLFGETDS